MDETVLSFQKRFSNITFSDFKKMAKEPTLSCYEKIGFPNAYRNGKEDLILEDIACKLSNINHQNNLILDIGAGCSSLPQKLADLCCANQNHLIRVDSKEMLDLLPCEDNITNLYGAFPRDCRDFIEKHQQKISAILVYSVLQYVFAEGNLFEFVDLCLSLLAPGGQLLLGDIPNASKRKRFLSSDEGICYHKIYVDSDSTPVVNHLQLEPGQIDDGVVMGIIMRCRQAGFDAYIVPQGGDLPMANRREDILIIRP
jgi:hypothetical protein